MKTGCYKCELNSTGDQEVYQQRGERGTYTYSIPLALETLRKRPRPTVEVPEEEVHRLLGHQTIYGEHLLHVDANKPGILARVGSQAILIDGSHRAARALREHRSFHVYMLSQAESDDCLVGFPIQKRA